MGKDPLKPSRSAFRGESTSPLPFLTNQNSQHKTRGKNLFQIRGGWLFPSWYFTCSLCIFYITVLSGFPFRADKRDLQPMIPAPSSSYSKHFLKHGSQEMVFPALDPKGRHSCSEPWAVPALGRMELPGSALLSKRPRAPAPQPHASHPPCPLSASCKLCPVPQGNTEGETRRCPGPQK